MFSSLPSSTGAVAFGSSSDRLKGVWAAEMVIEL